MMLRVFYFMILLRYFTSYAYMRCTKKFCHPTGTYHVTQTPLSVEEVKMLSTDADPSIAPLIVQDDMCLLPGTPLVHVEKAPNNARRIYTGIDILANIDHIWNVMTNYENLHHIVPSLVRNEVLERYNDGGAKLRQVGGTTVFPGVQFTAELCLDIRVYFEDNPLPDEMLSKPSFLTSTVSPLQRGVFPQPFAISKLPHRDITMQNIEGTGDFDHYQAMWRLQNLPDCAPDGGHCSRLTYAVEIKPKGLLPVKLIEGRIVSDLQANLEAIRAYVERSDRYKYDD